jgi:acylphosphatase
VNSPLTWLLNRSWIPVFHPKESHVVLPHRLGEERAEQRSKCAPTSVRFWIQVLILGQVEGEAQGEEHNIQKLLNNLDKGPSHAHVVKVEKEEKGVQEGETAFEVRA